MLTKTIFAVAFLLLIGVTLAFPSFPPAQLLTDYLQIPQTTLSIWGISVATLLNGITNAVIWTVIAATIYGLALHTKSEPLPPIPPPPHLSTPPPEAMLVDTRVNKIPPSITVRERPIGMEQDVETIKGIGPKCGGLLRNSGIKTVNDLVTAGATKRGRHYLANKVGVTYATMLTWVYRGDLLRISGVGKKYSSLLEAAGVNTVTDLSMRNPRLLCQTLRTVNREKNLVRRTPPSKTIEIWVKNARNLKPLVK
jgi:predicted flap endonuclease-1-like 5' DNA nuclease